MRNCFTKITNVFRKKSIQNAPERDILSEEENLNLRQRQHCECKDVCTQRTVSASAPATTSTTTTSPTTTLRLATTRTCVVSGCSCSGATDKHSSVNNRDGGNDKRKDIEHDEIKDSGGRDSSMPVQQEKAIKTSNQTTPSLGGRTSDKQQSFRRSLKNYRKNMNETTNRKAHCYEQEQVAKRQTPANVSGWSHASRHHELGNATDNNDEDKQAKIKVNDTEIDKLIIIQSPSSSPASSLKLIRANETGGVPQCLHNCTHLLIPSLTPAMSNQEILARSNTSIDDRLHEQPRNKPLAVANKFNYFKRPRDQVVNNEDVALSCAQCNDNPKTHTDSRWDAAPPKLTIAMSAAIANTSEAIDGAKTPEEIEYEAKVAAEFEDVMTPLPTDAMQCHPLAFGRNVHPEIAEVIRSLDANALRINNLTVDDKFELLRRFDSKHQPRRLARSVPPTGHSIHIDLEFGHYIQNRHSDELSDSSTEGVILRRKLPPSQWIEGSHSGLYERRQPKSPKLKLVLEGKKKDSLNGSDKTVVIKNARERDSERNLYDVKYPTVLPPNPQLKALLVFHKTDNICEVVQQACNRQQLEVTLVRTKDNALENLCSATECFHIIIIDARSPKHLDAEHIARSIRHMSGHHFTTIIAVVKKSIFDRDDVINALLDAGVNRCIAETTSLSMCTMELKQILHSIVRPHNVISTQQALYTALHRLKEVLIITDDLMRIQYANRSAERLLNMRLDEVINKPLAEIFISDVSSINSNIQGKSLREFDGILTVKRKNQEGIPMHVRVVPVACIGRIPTHFVFNFDVPGGHTDFIATLPQPKEAPRGSLHSIRRGSFDVRSIASDGLRRTSLAKLTSLPLEAPITKIINLLSQVQENCSSDEARLIDKVMEFLKREGLYSPQMKEIRTDDPIATDLIGALLTGPNVYSSRRSSNDSIVRTNCTNRQSTTMPAKMKATPLIMEILEESLNWEFNIFKLEEITERHPLLYLGMEIFRRFDVFATLNVDESVCKNWLAVIERNYHADNSYHNSTHAADVMQATGVFISQLAAKDLVMDRLEEAAALIAAAAHDVDHPGRSSAFLCNSNSPLAIMYNDLTVLESHHASTTFRLTLGDDNANIFKNLDSDTYKLARTTIIDMILATEMTRHFEHLAKFVSVFGAELEPRDIAQSEEESSVLMRRMLIKVADVSNPARPMICCIEWSRRIAEEYFMQTDEEKAKSLPIVMPMFDRGTCSIPKSQIGFIEYIIQDMMHAWDSFIDMPELITYMQINYSQWKKFEEQGIHTLAEVKAKQMSLMNKKSALK